MNWYIREPQGLIKGDYPFSQKYKRLIGAEETRVFALTQDEGMKPENISGMFSEILNEVQDILGDLKECKYLVITEKTNELDGWNEWSDYLLDNSRDIKGVWYWDGLLATAEKADLHLLIQPESDGMDIVIYLSGDKASDGYNQLVSWFGRRQSK